MTRRCPDSVESMTVERTPRPEGGYTITAYIDLTTGAPCAKDKASGALVSEYDADDVWLGEAVVTRESG